MSKLIDKAKYREISVDGRKLEAVYREQIANTTHECDSETCMLGGRILPMSDYVRVYYEDTDEVEKFHAGCFKHEFAQTS